MLPGIGFAEIIVIALGALIIVGPKDLPMMMRKLGQMLAKGRALANEFQAAFDDIAKQSELEELRKEIEDLKKNNDVTAAAEELTSFEKDMNEAVMRASGDDAA